MGMEIVSRPGARFYVTLRFGGKTSRLLGPYVSHMTALDNLERGRQLLREAQDAGRLSADESIAVEFGTYGTCSSPKSAKAVFGR